ncbi:MAG: 2'-5' RNA ligase family protein [Candidatus Paceibacterota bacterium]|jgi:2'-5' RNA ligase
MRQSYFIAHLLGAPVAKYHGELVEELAKKFDLEVSKGYFPTHITHKAPFEADEDEIVRVKDSLQRAVQDWEAGSYVVQGFSHFGRQIISLDIVHSIEVEDFHQLLIEKLMKLRFLDWLGHEPVMALHIALAKKGLIEKFDEVWDYLQQKQTPAFHRSLDNIALLRLDGNVWVIDSFYTIGPRTLL